MGKEVAFRADAAFARPEGVYSQASGCQKAIPA